MPTVTETPEVKETEVTEAQATEVKTFTQEEVNAIISKEKKRFEKTQLSKEEIEEFNAYKKTKQTNEDKYLELEKKLNSTVNELKDSKINSILLKSNANDIDYVKFKVNQIKEDDESFEDALERFKEKNGQYFETKKGEPTFSKANNNTGTEKKSSWEEYKAQYAKERGRE